MLCMSQDFNTAVFLFAPVNCANFLKEPFQVHKHMVSPKSLKYRTQIQDYQLKRQKLPEKYNRWLRSHTHTICIPGVWAPCSVNSDSMLRVYVTYAAFINTNKHHFIWLLCRRSPTCKTPTAVKTFRSNVNMTREPSRAASRHWLKFIRGHVTLLRHIESSYLSLLFNT